MSKQQTSNWDALTGLFSILFGLIYGGYAYTMPKPMFGNPWEAIFLPLAISAIAIFIGVLLIIKGGIAPSIQAIKDILNEEPAKKKGRQKILITAIVCTIYILLFEHLGYVLSTTLFMLTMLLITSGFSYWLRALIISVLFSVLVFVIFNYLLSINLPPFPF